MNVQNSSNLNFWFDDMLTHTYIHRYIPTYLLPTHLHTYLLTHPPTYLPMHPKICLCLYLCMYVHTCVNKKYSRTSIYRSRIDRFPASTIRHFWSRIKFHINNVIYSRIHRSPNYRFPAFIVCKSTSRHRISRMDHLKKN